MARSALRVEPGRAATIVNANTQIRGDLDVQGDLIVHGRVEGTIRVHGMFTLGAEAMVVGNTECQNARISGRIKGNLKAREGVDLLQGSKLAGDVYTRSLRIEEGAILQGMSYMGESYVEDDDD
ncbi:MAG: polymer-forming cytoskeletal protein [Candidatus Eisenbacteria bacterium]